MGKTTSETPHYEKDATLLTDCGKTVDFHIYFMEECKVDLCACCNSSHMLSLIWNTKVKCIQARATFILLHDISCFWFN